LFEGPMTQLEDRIAASHLLSNPGSAPDDGLDWLGSWIGIDPDPLPPSRRRARIVETPKLYRERGTVQGIADALDVATGGLCQRGVEREKPAHVAVTYMRASQPFLIGMASLVGVNTYLAPGPPRELARIDVSEIGGHAFIAHVAALDPRLEDARAAESFVSPIARLAGPGTV